MNAGFSSLTALKRELLLPADAELTDYDDFVMALGRGVAAMFESFCDRKFTRQEWIDIFSADRWYWITRAYPIETVSLVEVRDNYSAGYRVIPAQPANVVEMSGQLDFIGWLGTCGASARVTYTGGYWWDDSEDNSGMLPEGATALPDDLRAAWLMQCRWFWERRSITDRAKAGFTNERGDDHGFAGVNDELLAPVRLVISSYRRIAP